MSLQNKGIIMTPVTEAVISGVIIGVITMFIYGPLGILNGVLIGSIVYDVRMKER